MKKCILVIALIMLEISLFGRTFPAKIFTDNAKKAVEILNDKGISIDNVKQNEILVYVNDNQFIHLEKDGFAITEIPDQAKIYASQLWEETRDSDNPLRDYFTYDEYVEFMQTTAENYPEICTLVNAGPTVQNRNVWFLKISDNVNENEPEPEIKYVSSIHGDETAGMYFLTQFITLLTSQYGENDRITNIVDNTEIWINPLMNPDGYVLNQRYNANDIDLNRSFPDFEDDPEINIDSREPEIQAMINFSSQHQFSLGLTYHGGAVVVNYPYDTTYDLAPDDDLIQDMSLTYSVENAPMYNSSEFENGITNGAAWYVVSGSMQDWNYFYEKNIELTIEVSHIKWPPVEDLPGLWDDNRESLFKLTEYAQLGLHGFVTDENGNPLDAVISVQGNEQIEKTDSENGDYHRLLLPGNYVVTASAYGYEPQTATIEIDDSQIANHDFVLSQIDSYSFSGIVKDQNNNPIEGAFVKLNINQIEGIITDENGIFSFPVIAQGTYEVTVSKEGFISNSFEININDNVENYLIHLVEPTYFEPFNDLTNWNVNGDWAIQTANGKTFVTDSPNGNYEDNENSQMTIINPIDLSAVNFAELHFTCKYSIETDYDFCYIKASSDNQNWENIFTFTGGSDWNTFNFDLADYIGGNLYLKFAFESDSYVNQDGIMIDEFMIETNLDVSNDNNIIPITDLRVEHFPNPFVLSKGKESYFKIINPLKSETTLEIYNVKGQIVYNIDIEPNKNKISWNGLDSKNKKVASGVYFYRVKSNDSASKMHKMVIIK